MENRARRKPLDQPTSLERARDQAKIAVAATQKSNEESSSRSKAIAITHLETAVMWLERAQREVEAPHPPGAQTVEPQATHRGPIGRPEVAHQGG